MCRAGDRAPRIVFRVAADMIDSEATASKSLKILMLIVAQYILHGLGLAMSLRESWYFAVFMDDA